MFCEQQSPSLGGSAADNGKTINKPSAIRDRQPFLENHDVSPPASARPKKPRGRPPKNGHFAMPSTSA
jgi:hypothetical protein